MTFLCRCSATAEINTRPLFNRTVSADYLALIHRFDYLGLINLEIGEEIRSRMVNRQYGIRAKIDWMIKEGRIILEILDVGERERENIERRMINKFRYRKLFRTGKRLERR